MTGRKDRKTVLTEESRRTTVGRERKRSGKKKNEKTIMKTVLKAGN